MSNSKKQKPSVHIVDRLTEAISALDQVLQETEGIQALQGESQILSDREGQVITFYIDGAYFHMERYPGSIRAQEMSLGDQSD